MKRTVVLLSGGIDSMVCAFMLRGFDRNVSTLFVNYGQCAADAERKAAENIADYLGAEHKSIVIMGGSSFGVGEIPARNLLLISVAATTFTQGHWEIAIGIHAGVPYFDCGEEFYLATHELISRSTDGGLALMAPLLTWEKPQILRYALDQGLPLGMTYSCERGTLPPCGECLSCQDREALSC